MRDGSTSALLPGNRIASQSLHYFLQLAVPQTKIDSNCLATRQGDSVFVLRNGALRVSEIHRMRHRDGNARRHRLAQPLDGGETPRLPVTLNL